MAGNLDVTKVGTLDLGGDGVANVGDVIDYVIDVTNVGPVPVSAITMVDGNADPGSITCAPSQPFTLAVGATASCTATHTLSTADIAAGAVGNQATATGQDPAGNVVTDDSDDPADLTNTDPDDDGDPEDPTIVTIPGVGGEICDNCVDDDGDGLVDVEDPDCCAMPASIDVRRVRLLAHHGDRTDARGVIRGRIDPSFGAIDPRQEDVTVQLRDATGPVACCVLTTDEWMRLGRRTFGFWDRQARICPPLADVALGNRRSGRLKLTIRLKRLDLDDFTGPELGVTVGAAGRCASGMAVLRPKATKGWRLP